MGLTQKILLFISLLVVALVLSTVAFTTVQADRLAQENIQRGLTETRSVWDTFQADRYNKLKLGIRVLANDAPFKAAITSDQATVYDLLQERGKDLGADFFIATDASGVVIARSDRPGAQGTDLASAPLVKNSLEGTESATVWEQDGKLFHAVAVPMQFGQDIIGVLVAGYGINEALAAQIRKLTHSEIAYLVHKAGGAPELSVSSLGPKEEALKPALSRFAGAGGEDKTFEVDLGSERFIGTQIPLKSTSGTVVGSVLPLRSLNEEMAGFRRFRSSLLVVSVVIMLIGLGAGYLVASKIAGPVRRLVELVEKARAGTYTGAVHVESGDEIGTLSRTFNSLLADLREKEQMIDFLREGMTMMKKAPGVTDASGDTAGVAETAAIAAVQAPMGVSLEKGSVFAGRYQILNLLGKGGMGVVFRAHDQKLEEDVAVKVLRPDVVQQDPTLLERFKQEIKLARKISHRNVLRTHDFDDVQGTPYISMEYLEGVALKDLIEGKGALPVPVGLRIAKQICLGLEAAHQEGVVHRDIKPQNMLILPETGDLKIMDFGIARLSEVKPGGTGLTTQGTVMGTPDYMPPEQAQGHGSDFRSDIYSLGVVFYEMFTGKLPFTGNTVMEVVLAHIQKPVPPPRSVMARIPADLERVILKCLDKAPDRRYQRVSEILEDLTDLSSRAEAA